MIAFIIKRKSPKVTMVIGRVKITNIGFTIRRNKAITIATIIAEPYPSTATPERILDKRTTAKAVINSLIRSFIFIDVRFDT